MCANFVDQLPAVEFCEGLVRTTYRSGDVSYTTVSTRAFMRRYLETTIRALNEFERAQQCEVIEMRPSRHG